MKCPKCKMKIPNGAEICPYCRSKVQDEGLAWLGGQFDAFSNGYKKGSKEFNDLITNFSNKGSNSGCMVTLSFAVVLAASAYFLFNIFI